MNVWIQSPSQIIAEALSLMVVDLGFEPTDTADERTEAAVWDLTHGRFPFPAPPQTTPTLALVLGDEHLADLLRQGYRGYVRPEEGGDVLRQALNAVRRGEIWAERQTLTKAIDRLAQPQLTAREEEIHDLISQGLSNRAVARKLGISERTVKAHASRLYEKLGVNGRVELIVQARSDAAYS